MDIKFINDESAITTLRSSLPENYATNEDVKWLWDNVVDFLAKANSLWENDDYDDSNIAEHIKDEVSEMLDKVIDLKLKKADIEHKKEKTRQELKEDKKNFMVKFFDKTMEFINSCGFSENSENNSLGKSGFIAHAAAEYEESFKKLLEEFKDEKRIDFYALNREDAIKIEKSLSLTWFCDFFSKAENQTEDKYQEAGMIILDMAHVAFVYVTEFRNQQEILFLESLALKLENWTDKEDAQ